DWRRWDWRRWHRRRWAGRGSGAHVDAGGWPMTRRRAFATLLVFGVIVLGALVVSVLQASSFSQATAGREAIARVRAHWAARAGLEMAIARIEDHTETPDLSSAYAIMDDIAGIGEGTLPGASWRIATTEDGREVLGATDAHAKLNVNRLTRDQLLTLEPFMSDDVADSLLDWIDADEDPNTLGAELGYYRTLPHPYQPRNGAMRSIAEMELVAGMDARDVRGEDWNLNGLLDLNENDGDASWPPDNADGALDAGYSGILTAASVEGTMALSGEAYLDLTATDANELAARLKVTREQADAILEHMDGASNPAVRDFILTDLTTLVRRVRQQQSDQQGARQFRVEALSTEQLGALLDECTIGPPAVGAFIPGKLNINSCDAKTLEYIPQITPETADAIIAERSARPQGFTSLGELLAVPGIGRRQLAAMYELLCVRSNVYVVTSRGRDERTGIEVEIRATIDRSALPVVLQEVTVR
ncbi:MAG: type II secretion system protein GspK, partial [Planctomycetota bacterium]|nr:type II secretion system protein GspK [Planctomycetota bacterium]